MKTKKNNLNSIVLVFIFCLQIFSVGFDNPFYNFEENLTTGDELGPNQDINSALDGLYEEKNFIPEGVYSEKFNPSVWIYDDANSYVDTYWGDGSIISGLTTQTKTNTQNWNPFNDYVYDSNSYVAGSTDFEDLGVGAIQLDSARRTKLFSLNNTDMNESTGLLHIDESTPSSVGYLTSGEEFNSTGRSVYGNSLSNVMMYTEDWTFQDNPRSYSYTYPANTYESGTILGPAVLQSSTTTPSGTYGDYADSKIAPQRSYSVNYDQDTISIEAARTTWWHLYIQSTGQDGTIDNTQYVNAYWDTSFDYSTEIRMYFYYDQTTDSTNAYYGADVNLNEIGELEYHPLDKVVINSNYQGYEIANETFYQTDITGELTYDIWEYNGGSPVMVPNTQSIKSFSEDSGTGAFDDDVSITQSGDFGSELDSTGWYFLQMTVDLTHHQYGYFRGIRNDPNHIDNAIYEYFEQDNGVSVDIVEPYVEITESTPYDFPSSPEQILITSEPVAWGSKRSILPDSPAELTFGYQIPTAIRSANAANLSETLEKARVFAILEIGDNSSGEFGADYTFINYSSHTFADVRGASLGYGLGCDQFGWILNSAQRAALDNSGRLRWTVGIEIESGVELSYFTDSQSKVYFSNIDFTVQTEVFIDAVFTIKDDLGRLIDQTVENPISDLNFSIFKESDQSLFSSYNLADLTDGSLSVTGMYNETWRLIVKVKYGAPTYYTIFNSTYVLDSAISTSNYEIMCNLTNVKFYIPNLVNGHVLMEYIDNPSVSFSSLVTSEEALFTQIPFGDYRIKLQTESGFIVTNYTKTIEPLYSPVFNWEIFYLSLNSSELTLNKNLTNTQLNIVDPSLNDISGATVTLTNLNDPTIIKSGITDVNGNVTLTEVYETSSNWQLTVTSSDDYVIYDSVYQVRNSTTSENEELIFDTILCNLTNVQFTINDYSGTPVSNSVSPSLQLINKDGTSFSGNLDNGIIEFLGVYNSTESDSWNLVVDVAAGSGREIILNFSLSIATASDYIFKEFDANLTTYELTIIDLDGSEIPDAVVNFTNNADSSITYEAISDGDGKVRFQSIFSASWNMWVKYTVGAASSGLTTEYLIYEETNYDLIDPQDQDYIISDSLGGCNLTTINLMVWDADDSIPIDYRGLYNANITLRNFYTGLNITYLQSNAQGNLTIRCPSSIYNITVNYQNKYRSISISPTNGNYGVYNWTISANLIQTKIVYVSLSELKTGLTNTDLDFGKSGEGWDSVHDNNQTSDISSDYYLSLYYGDSVEIELFFYYITSGLAVEHDSDDTTGSWILKKDGITKNSSSNVNELTEGSGLYNISIFSTQYGAGTYELIFEIGGENDGGFPLQSSTFSCEIRILNHTTKFQRITSTSELAKQWDQDIVISLNYTTVLPEIMNISDSISTIEYNIQDTVFSGTLASLDASSSVYLLTVSKYSLNVGVYTISLSASAGNLTAQSLTVVITILPVDTQTDTFIESDFKISDTSLRTSITENITTFLNYTYVSNSSQVNDASITVYLDTIANPIMNYYYGLGEWQYNCTVSASGFSLGFHEFYIITEKMNHENSTIKINVEILSTWSSKLEIVNPPLSTSWSNNATFYVYYECTSEPRLSDPLSDAEISQLSITYMEGATEVEEVLLSSSDTAIWTWENLKNDGAYGDGYYRIEVNTSVLEVASEKLFYIIPTIEQSQYSIATVKPWVSIRPVDTSLTPFDSGSEIQEVELYFDDSIDINVIMNVTESSSSILGKRIDGALIEYNLYNVSQPGSNSIERGYLDFTENGEYNFTFLASKVGSFLLEFTMELTNYSLSEKSSVSISVLRRSVDFVYSIGKDFKISSNAIKIAQTEVLSLGVQFLSFLEIYPTLSGRIDSIGLDLDVYEVNTGEYICNKSLVNFPAGQYTLTLSAQKENTATKTVDLELEIIEFWETEIDVINPPIIYPWGENSTFTMKYYCSESPRNGLALSGAEISGLNITSIQGEKENLIHSLGANTMGSLWGWNANNDLGTGYYDVWFNTGIVSVAKQTVFYAIPIINVSVYAEAWTHEHLLIEPLKTALIPLMNASSSSIVETINIELDETVDMGVKLFVSDDESHLENNVINNAGVVYYIYNLANNKTVEIEDGDLTFDSNGFYLYHFNGNTLGSYRIKIVSSIMNYSNAETTFDIIVGTKTIDVVSIFDEIAIEGVINTPQNQGITFSVELGIQGANVVLSFNNREYVLVEGDAGVYSYVFTPAELKTHNVNSYLLTLAISKENYTTIEETVTFAITLPVDPYLGVTFQNWIIIGSTLGAVVVIIMVQQGIKRARIPLIIKQIDATKKDMEKKHDLPDGLISLTAKDEIVEVLAERWQILDLDLASILGVNDVKTASDSVITTGDEEVGGL
ncbi:hypothetical protein [Candidatus Lokiarchaeum ossiferum]|uniref:hypothetical protein n=1 Tax=Candidatus Lokiarchaeum ossiferum TaxID=2951803 RepID=UPI00352C7F63